jgi:hypothetical protein
MTSKPIKEAKTRTNKAGSNACVMFVLDFGCLEDICFVKSKSLLKNLSPNLSPTRREALKSPFPCREGG